MHNHVLGDNTPIEDAVGGRGIGGRDSGGRWRSSRRSWRDLRFCQSDVGSLFPFFPFFSLFFFCILKGLGPAV